MFKEATRKKLRFFSSKGKLSVEDLWDLSLKELDAIAQEVNNKLSEAETSVSFLSTKKKAPSTSDDQLRLEILVVIIQTLEAENLARAEAALKKEKKERLMSLIAQKQEAVDENRSIEELQAMLDDL